MKSISHYLRISIYICFILTCIGSSTSFTQSYPAVAAAELESESQWTIQLAPFPDGYLDGISFINKDQGWAVGFNEAENENVFLSTTDGGAQWNYQTVGFSAIKVAFTDNMRGFIIGADGIRHTVDGGASWLQSNMPSYLFFELRDILMTSPTEGWIVGEYVKDLTTTMLLLHTSDGVNWNMVNTPDLPGSLGSVFFTDSNTGFAAGNKDNPLQTTILKTTDGGQNWTEEVHPSAAGELNSIFFINQNTGWISGGTGYSENDNTLLFKTTDGGQNWMNISPGIGSISNAVHFVSDMEGYMDVKIREGLKWSSSLYKSTDGGTSWNPALNELPSFFGSDIMMVEGSLWAWIAGSFSECGLYATAEPEEGGKVIPSSISCECGNNNPLTFNPVANEGWQFLEYSPKAPHECPDQGIQNVIAKFGPFLTVSGAQETFFCAQSENSNVHVFTFSLTASKADSWGVLSIPISSMGNGNETEDIKRLSLFNRGIQIDDYKSFDQDNGTVIFNLDVPISIAPGASESFSVFLDFNKKEDCPDEVLEFSLTPSITTSHAIPLKYDNGLISTGANAKIFLGCTWNNDEAFANIMDAVNGTSTGGTVFVCPGTYEENIKLDNPITIKSINGAEVTIVEPKDSQIPVFEIRAKDVNIEGLTIRYSYDSGILVRRDNSRISRSIITDNMNGIYLYSSVNAEIRENQIYDNSENGILIQGTSSTHNKIYRNFIGTDQNGMTRKPNKIGIQLNGGTNNNHIGSITDGRNLISGNDQSGIYIFDSDNNEIKHNDIGTTKDGQDALYNNNGIEITNESSSNKIYEWNTISGNMESGILIEGKQASNNEIWNNRIGTNGTGDGKVANKYGITIEGSPDNHIGKTVDGGLNIISGNTMDGIRIQGKESKSNTVQGNTIGLNEKASSALKNNTGILIHKGASGNIIGGENIISGNSENGILITGEETTMNQVLGNIIGTNKEGLKTLKNKYGIKLSDGTKSNTIGGTIDVFSNIISGNGHYGIFIEGGVSVENKILGNYIGTDAKGENSIENLIGIGISDSRNNQIGGDKLVHKNIISGNFLYGLELINTENISIYGNHIGINKKGDKALPNSTGVLINKGFENTIGNNSENYRNVISGNNAHGILMKYTVLNNVWGNYIGADISGKTAQRNKKTAIRIENSVGNKIGGTDKGYKNVIIGSEDFGINILNSKKTILHGNHIGTGITGTESLGSKKGVGLFRGSNNTISNNKIFNHCQGILDDGVEWKKGKKSKHIIVNNKIENSWCLTSGIHVSNTKSLIIGNQITNDQGDAIITENGASPVIRKNNIFDNDGFALNNLDPSKTINALNNWWGSDTGPDMNAINGNIDFTNWETEPVDLVLAIAADTVYTAPGTPDSVGIYFRNWLHPMDRIDITITDEQGWLTGVIDTSIIFQDSLGADSMVYFAVPAGIPEGTNDKVFINIQSQLDPSWTDSDSFYIMAYTSLMSAMEIYPERIVAYLGDSVQFIAAGFDDLGNFLLSDNLWSATGGAIDSFGLYNATELGEFEIHVLSSDSTFNASAMVSVVESLQATDDIADSECNIELLLDILENDIGAGLNISETSTVQGISIEILSDDILSVTGVSTSDFSFSYMITDQLGETDTATVWITVTIPDEIWYNGIDENCDGADDFDQDGDGFIPDDFMGIYEGNLPFGDCDDKNAEINPGVTDVCDHLDNNCDGLVDNSSCTDLAGDVGSGFEQTVDNFDYYFQPVELETCDSVFWLFAGQDFVFTQNSTGNEVVTVNIGSHEVFTVCMEVSRFNLDGSICSESYCASTTSVRDIHIDKLKIHPNPTNNNLYLEVPHKLHGNTVLLDLLTLSGEKVFSSTIHTQLKNLEFDLGTYPNGVYLLILKDMKQEKLYINKIVKE